MKNFFTKKTFSAPGGQRKSSFKLIQRSLTLFLICFIHVGAWAFSQPVTLKMGKVTIYDALKAIKTEANVEFFYSDNELDVSRKVDVKFDNVDVVKAVSTLVGDKYNVILNEENIVLITPKNPQTSRKNSNAEKITIKGKVTDENGLSLPGVNVIIKGTNKGVVTDWEGNYTIKVDENVKTLTFRYVGYIVQDVELNGQTTLNISLKPDTTKLQEVVVVGYGEVEKKDLTGSVSTLKSKDIEDLAPTINVDQALQGKVSGVMVVQETGQPGSAARVRIRGTSSLLGSNQPLYVIDGIPVVAQSNIPNTGDAFDNELYQQGLSTPLGNINMADIESVNILKDASAAAIYGSRAANGVIIITTKRGKFQEKPQFNAGFSFSTQQVKTTEVLNAAQFREIYTEAVENSGSTNAFATSVLDGTYFGESDTNWEDEISRNNPLTQNFNFSVRGGNANTRYYTSVGVQDQMGVFAHSEFQRYSMNFNLDSELSEKVRFGTNINASNSQQQAPDGGLLDRIYDFRPDVPVYDEEGNYTFSSFYSLENPVALSTANINNETNLLLGSVYGELDLMEGLTFKSMASVNLNNGNSRSFYPSATFTGGFRTYSGNGDGFGRQSSSQSLTHLWENTLSFKRIIANDHNINAVLGASWQGNRNKYLQASGKGFPKDAILTNLSSASKDFAIASNEIQSGLVSYFTRVNYGYDDRYLLTLSGRMDASSKFASENKWAFFPTVAAAWKISNESFMKGSDFFDELKLRASAGTTGQQNFGPYQWRTLYGATFYGNKPAVVRTQLGNSQLKWETTDQMDVALDFSLLKGRISGSAAYYQKNTKDLLYFVNVPGNTGTTTVIANIGDTQNKGFEFELSGDVIRSKDFNWNLTVNASRNMNKLVSLNEDFMDDRYGTINPPNTGSVLRIGDPIGLIFGYVAEGIFQQQSEIDALNSNSPTGYYQRSGTAPGDLKFKDISGPDGVPDGVIDSYDQTVIGNTQPDLFGGITSTWNYKGLSLTALFTYSVGNDLRWDAQRNGINVSSTYVSENKTIDIMNRWTADNPTDQPRVVYGDPNDNDRISSYYVHDASYLRLKNINLTYSLPSTLLNKTRFINKLAVYATATNLWTLSNYPGADPETNNLFDNDVSSGLDNARYPTPKVFTAGVKIGF